MEILATVIPMAGFGIIIACIQTCWGARLFGQLRNLERRVHQLENQSPPRVVVAAPQPVYPPGRYAYPYSYTPPQPSAPPGHQMV